MVKNGKTDLALMANDIKYIQRDVSDIKSKMEADFITREEFDPVKRIIYGLVAIILTAVVGALVGLVILK